MNGLGLVHDLIVLVDVPPSREAHAEEQWTRAESSGLEVTPGVVNHESRGLEATPGVVNHESRGLEATAGVVNHESRRLEQPSPVEDEEPRKLEQPSPVEDQEPRKPGPPLTVEDEEPRKLEPPSAVEDEEPWKLEPPSRIEDEEPRKPEPPSPVENERPDALSHRKYFPHPFALLGARVSISPPNAANRRSASAYPSEGDETVDTPARSNPAPCGSPISAKCALDERREVIMSNTTSSKSKATVLAQLQALITGLQKQFPNGQFTLGNTVFTTAALVQTLQSLIDAINAVNTAQANAKVALAALGVTVAKVGPVVLALKRNLLSMFGDATDTLALFGLEPRKAPAPRTGPELAAAAAKAKATRIARGTASKKKKLAVTGNVTGVSITPITAPTEAPPVPPATATPTAAPPGTTGK